MKTINRRAFVKSAVSAGIGMALARPFSRVLGANEAIRVAVVGLNGRGEDHIGEFRKISGVRIVALCDVDQQVLERRGKSFADRNEPVTTYADVRKLLEDSNVDAISVATPNHWHSLIAIWACQAGKDVYVEKPCSHTVFEGRQCVEAARKFKRVVQHGTQGRSSAETARQIAAVHSGKYGKLLVAKGYCCKPRWSIGFKPYKEPPANLDFNLWLGPAPDQPFHENLVHYNWHWFWDFGNGDIGNQGVHQMDIARWAIQGATLPETVISMGGRWVDGPSFRDQGQTPNMELCIYEFEESLLVFETRGLVGKNPAYPNKVSNEFYLERGVIRDGKFFPQGKSEGEPLEQVEVHLNPGGHFENFIQCVRDRKVENLNADILEGHYSSALCHLGNISYEMGWEVPFRYEAKALGDCDVISQSMMTILENTKAIGVDPAKTSYRLGPKLHFKPRTEKFVDNVAADWQLTRVYREPFVVPKSI